jgi:hypothetical protein
VLNTQEPENYCQSLFARDMTLEKHKDVAELLRGGGSIDFDGEGRAPNIIVIEHNTGEGVGGDPWL